MEQRITALDAATLRQLDTLRQELDQAAAWKPETAGDFIAGVVTRWQTVEPKGDAKKRCAVLTVLSEDGERSVWCYASQLRRRLIHPGVESQADAELIPAELRLARAGDLVAIEYRGQFVNPTIDGATYRRFQVAISRPVPAPGAETVNVPEFAADDDGIPF
jgi:hypothetical protein